MKPIKKFSTISDETTRIMESLKEAHGPALLDIVKKLGYNSLEEISKQKAILTKLESLLKEIPGAKEISEDEADDIEDEVVKRGTPKDVSDKTGEKEEDKEPGASNKVEEDDAEDIEDEVVKRGKPKSLEDKEGEEEEDGEVGASNKEVAEEEDKESEEDKGEESEEVKGEEKETPKATRKIMTFEDFVKEDETVNKNVNYNDDEDDEDNAELDAASADPLAEDEQVDASGLAIPLETGDGTKTATEIEDEKVKMGEPEKLNDAEGEVLVTKDQTVTAKVVGAGSIIKSFAAFVKESEEVGASGLAIPLVTGDGSKTAEEIEDEKVKMGEPEKLKDAEGEVLVTTDQEVTEDPKTSKDEPANVVVEGEINESVKYAVMQAGGNMGSMPRPQSAKGFVGMNINDDKVYYVSTNKEDAEDEAEKLTSKMTSAANASFGGNGYIVVPFKGNKFIAESVELNEEEVSSDAEFKEYATTVLKKAFGTDYDEAKATEVIDGLTKKYEGDYGAMVGALQKSLD